VIAEREAEIRERLLDIEAAELMLRVDASQAPEPRLSMQGHAPAIRLRGRGGAFEAVDALATNLVSQLALTAADDFGVEVDRLKSGALTVTAAAFAGPAAVSFLTIFEGPSITLAAAAGVAVAAVFMLALGRRVGAITLLVIGLMLGFTSQGLTSVLLHFAARAGGRVYGGWQDASFAAIAPASLPWLLAKISQ